MNLSYIMKKLQRAILQTGLPVTVSTSQFYSADQNRFITMWELKTKTYTQTAGGWTDKSYEIIRTASAPDVVECLKEIYEAMRGWGEVK